MNTFLSSSSFIEIFRSSIFFLAVYCSDVANAQSIITTSNYYLNALESWQIRGKAWVDDISINFPESGSFLEWDFTERTLGEFNLLDTTNYIKHQSQECQCYEEVGIEADFCIKAIETGNEDWNYVSRFYTLINGETREIARSLPIGIDMLSCNENSPRLEMVDNFSYGDYYSYITGDALQVTVSYIGYGTYISSSYPNGLDNVLLLRRELLDIPVDETQIEYLWYHDNGSLIFPLAWYQNYTYDNGDLISELQEYDQNMAVSITDQILPNDLNVVASDNSIQIKNGTKYSWNCEIYLVDGKSIYLGKVKENANMFLPLQHSGLYFVKLSNDQIGSSVAKVFIN